MGVGESADKPLKLKLILKYRQCDIVCDLEHLCGFMLRCLCKSHPKSPKVEQERLFIIDAALQSQCCTDLNSVIAGNGVQRVKSHEKMLQCERGLSVKWFASTL